jgi:hypothetical protein
MSGPPPPIGHGGPGADASRDGTLDGTACPTTIPNGAPVVTQVFVGEPEPLPIGGSIVQGTYFLTAANVYTGVGGNAGPTGFTFQETLSFNTANATFEDVEVQTAADGGAATSHASTGSFTTLGTSLDFQVICPAASTVTSSFSVINSTVHTFQGSSELVYTLQ